MSKLNKRRLVVNIIQKIWIGGVFSLTIFHMYFALVKVFELENVWEKAFSFFFALIEGLILFQIFLINFFLTSDKYYPLTDNIEGKPSDEFEQVSILVPTKNPDINVLNETLTAIRDLNYPKEMLIVWIGDDTTTDLKSEIELLCKKFGFNYYNSGTQRHFKAGMLNILLEKINSKYFIVLDYDQKPDTGLVIRLLAEFKSRKDPKLAFVQAIKRFKNISSLSGFFSSILYLQYFEVVQRPKNRRKTVLFAGSTAMFRTDVVKSIGGFSIKSITEDTETAVQLILRGYYGQFINYIGSWGSVPSSYTEQISQIWRWTMGGSQSLRLNFPAFLRNPKLNLTQRIDLISTLGITFIIPFIFIYGIAVWVISLLGLDTPRYGFQLGTFLISSQIFIPFLGLLTYLVILSLAIQYAREESDQGEAYSWKLIVPMTMIGISTSVLILPASLMGFLKIEDPESGKAKWNRDVKLFRNSLIFAAWGIILIYQGFSLIINGLFTGTLVFIEGVIFLHPIIVSTVLYVTNN